MFIFSIKTSKRKLIMHLAVVIALIIILGIFFATLNASDKEAVAKAAVFRNSLLELILFLLFS